MTVKKYKIGLLYPAILFVVFTSVGFSQENIFTAGFQYKPILPSAFFGTGTKTVSQKGIDFSIEQDKGVCLGMIVRRGFTKRLSFETGINYTKRLYHLTLNDTGFTNSSDFKIIGYEIPLQGLIFLQLAKHLFMNASAGVSVDMYPTNIKSYNDYFFHFSKRHSLFQFSSLFNTGCEYRTKKSGYFYLGASYHLPFSYFYNSSIQYIPDKVISSIKLSGNYLSLDLRYYFHEEPIKPRVKKKKTASTPNPYSD